MAAEGARPGEGAERDEHGLSHSESDHKGEPNEETRRLHGRPAQGCAAARGPAGPGVEDGIAQPEKVRAAEPDRLVPAPLARGFELCELLAGE